MTRPGWRRLLPLTAGLLLLTAVPAAPAQQKAPSAAFLEGTEVFRRILFEMQFQPLATFDDLNDPKHTIFIVLGDARRLNDVRGGLRTFVDQGGALLLATDRKLPWDPAIALEQTAGVAVMGQTVACDDSTACYRGLAYCPFLRPVEDADPDLFRNLRSSDSALSTVASNVPSYLLRIDNNLDARPPLPALAALPDNCYPDRLPPPPRTDVFDPPPLFAVGGDVGDGRVLVLADHSIFINEMMFPADEGNVEFTYNCLEWLHGDGDEPRTKVLFLEDGNINTRFEVPLKDTLPDELMDRILDYTLRHLPELAQKATPALERDIKHIDERGGFNRMILRWLKADGGDPRDVLWRILAVVLAVAVVLYGCYKVGWKARYRADLQGPSLPVALYRLAPGGSAPEQRRQAMIRNNNLWEPARELARQCLGQVGAPAAIVPPRVVVRGGWWRRWTTAGRVKRLWRLAYGPPVRVSRNDWKRLLRDVKELKAALADGTVDWKAPGERPA